MFCASVPAVEVGLDGDAELFAEAFADVAGRVDASDASVVVPMVSMMGGRRSRAGSGR